MQIIIDLYLTQTFFTFFMFFIFIAIILGVFLDDKNNEEIGLTKK